ncbi:hypothetical protein [Kineococcus sp. SYSU DK003]|uniref:hypothetical protein n=1 Tax=Kineococcus sp. SYSU DK003 TaxID=3383124 RepID=UPI003D7D929A
MNETTLRYRVTVIAHRRCGAVRTGGTAESGIHHVQTVRATSAEFARDLALVHLHAESALVSTAVVGVDAVVVERLRWGRSPVRELDSRRVVVVR